MGYAVRHRYISYNPVRDAEKPKGNGQMCEQDIRVLSPSETNALLKAVENKKYHTLFMLAIMSGARQGELLGLKWPDIDWKNNQIHIQRTFNNGAWYKPKTSTSRRRIDIGPAMLKELKKWRIKCPQSPFELVFPNEAGNPINHNNMVNRHFLPSLKAAELPHIRFHDLRHTYASLLIEQGENIKYIQNQLGHSSPTVTLNVYSHLMRDRNQEAACTLEKMILGNV
jgi:integrase